MEVLLFGELVNGLKVELKGIKSSSQQVIGDMAAIYKEISSDIEDAGKHVKFVDFTYLWLSLCDYSEKVDTIFSKINKAYDMEIGAYKERIAQLENSLAIKEQALNSVINLGLSEREQVLIGEVQRVLGLVERNAGVIGTAEGMKRKGKVHKGESNPNFKSNAKDEYLTELYKAGMSCKELGVRFGMTENGVRDRLKRLGVFKGRQYKKKSLLN